jgi:nucleotide-binding universal stress UspA family protein
MFKHLLVTLDGTPRGESVIPYATDVARSMKAKLTLLRVIESASADWSERGAIGKASADDTIRSLFEEQAESYLERVASQVALAGVAVQTSVRQGQPARQIVTAAKDLGVDAIAMSTHSRRGVSRLMFGSVAEQVLHETSLPVLLVRS